MQIRKAIPDDAGALVAYMNRVGGQTDFLSHAVDEYVGSVETEKASIHDCLLHDFQLRLVATIDEEIVGELCLRRTPLPRLSHIADLALTVDKNHWGRGIGKALLQAAIDWASDKKLHKIMFLVRTDNEAALALYTHFGATIEGTATGANYVGGRYYDSHLMAIAL